MCGLLLFSVGGNVTRQNLPTLITLDREVMSVAQTDTWSVDVQGVTYKKKSTNTILSVCFVHLVSFLCFSRYERDGKQCVFWWDDSIL